METDLVLEIEQNEIGVAEIDKSNAASGMERRIDCVALSRGVGIGPVVFFERGSSQFVYLADQRLDIEGEIVRFRRAVATATEGIRELMEPASAEPNGHLKDILNIQLLILVQSSFVANVEDKIRDERIPAEAALENVRLRHVQQQAGVIDHHHREKRLDIEDVCNRIASGLSGEFKTQGNIYSNAVVTAYELTPSEIVEISRDKPAAFVTERGGWTSHSSILAREFQIPMVSGVKLIKSGLSSGETIIVDGNKGIVVFDPTELSLSISAVEARVSDTDPSPSDSLGRNLCTVDGTQIAIRANADSPAAYELARKLGAEGIGLFRSETQIKTPGRIPREEEQLAAYLEVGEAVADKGVRIRTFDIGMERLSPGGRPTEVNPSLGLRSIRLSLQEKAQFRIQVRALLRAALKHRIEIVLPMISGVAEVEDACAIIRDEYKGLKRKGINVGEPRIGAMIEVPSAVFTAREIASKVDFLALGTNDLVQYLLAVDRDNDQVSDLYQTLNPAVIRALKLVVSAARSAKRSLLVCGEMAGSAFYVPLLIGLGVRELSMKAHSIRQIRDLISGISLIDAELLVSSLEEAETADQVEALMRNFYKEHWAPLFPPGLLDTKHR